MSPRSTEWKRRAGRGKKEKRKTVNKDKEKTYKEKK